MPSVGDILGNAYRLDRPVGEGGMGTIWRATHLSFGRQVAVKLLNQRDPEEVECFLREAKLLAAVRHRNVVAVMDFGRTKTGDPYLVMEYLKGEDLGERLSRRPEVSVPELVRILSVTLRALGAVHDAGIVHRDIKPENIFLVEDAHRSCAYHTGKRADRTRFRDHRPGHASRRADRGPAHPADAGGRARDSCPRRAGRGNKQAPRMDDGARRIGNRSRHRVDDPRRRSRARDATSGQDPNRGARGVGTTRGSQPSGPRPSRRRTGLTARIEHS